MRFTNIPVSKMREKANLLASFLDVDADELNIYVSGDWVDRNNEPVFLSYTHAEVLKIGTKFVVIRGDNNEQLFVKPDYEYSKAQWAIEFNTPF